MARASGLVLRRALSQRLIVAAAFGTILLATTVLSALLLYATTVTDNGVQRSLATAPIDQVGSRITAPVTPQTHSAIDTQVRSAASQAYAHARIQVVETARSDSYALPTPTVRQPPGRMRPWSRRLSLSRPRMRPASRLGRRSLWSIGSTTSRCA